MKGLKKIALASAITAVATSAQAEYKAMNDAMMSQVTGQSGISIDLTAEVSMGEIAYKDGGFIAARDIYLGGASGGALDNLTITVDVAGDATDIAALETTNGITGIGDGDLVIHIGATDGDVQNVDFGLGIAEVSLETSNYAPSQKYAGDASTNTVLLSNLALSGRLGPIDIVISEDTSNLWANAFFAVDSGSMDIPFMNVSIGNFTMDNSRPSGTPNGNFAQATVAMGASNKGLMVDVIDFSADMDVEDIKIGANSIGSLYITDLKFTATMDVYGH
ncbi:DUF6160 family protein [Alkalimarinus coralli]|uniref:DUF6160 family protein n=1 Tax=Alkalimarinus coralli TaxID=2935863 RepID=UPI00202B638C|nr:DUF6160 family protein [Alkalimarinus coralli]